MRDIKGFALIALVITVPQSVYGQQTTERNLQTCLTGKYPALCRHDLLSAEERIQVHVAELQENLRVCLSGKYPALCKHSDLTPDELSAVREGERAENLRVCLIGKYPALCNHAELTSGQAAAVSAAEGAENVEVCLAGKYSVLCRHELLSPEERGRVRAAEIAENLRVCMDGRYPALCQHSLLTPELTTQVAAAEANAAASLPSDTSAIRSATSTIRSACYESSVMSPTPFMGNNDEIFKLSDGSLWKVMYEYEYLYEYYPDVVICPSSGKLVVAGKTLNVEQIAGARAPSQSQPGSAPRGADVVESRIDGDFSGWDGETVFKLQNGQIWQQSSYAYKYKYAYSPEVVIYKSGSIYKMRVTGVDGEIAVRRLR